MPENLRQPKKVVKRSYVRPVRLSDPIILVHHLRLTTLSTDLAYEGVDDLTFDIHFRRITREKERRVREKEARERSESLSVDATARFRYQQQDGSEDWFSISGDSDSGYGTGYDSDQADTVDPNNRACDVQSSTDGSHDVSDSSSTDTVTDLSNHQSGVHHNPSPSPAIGGSRNNNKPPDLQRLRLQQYFFDLSIICKDFSKVWKTLPTYLFQSPPIEVHVLERLRHKVDNGGDEDENGTEHWVDMLTAYFTDRRLWKKYKKSALSRSEWVTDYLNSGISLRGRNSVKTVQDSLSRGERYTRIEDILGRSAALAAALLARLIHQVDLNDFLIHYKSDDNRDIRSVVEQWEVNYTHVRLRIMALDYPEYRKRITELDEALREAQDRTTQKTREANALIALGELKALGTERSNQTQLVNGQMIRESNATSEDCFSRPSNRFYDHSTEAAQPEQANNEDGRVIEVETARDFEFGSQDLAQVSEGIFDSATRGPGYITDQYCL